MSANTSVSGIGLVELFLGSTLLAFAVLGTVGGLMTSLKFAIDTKDQGLAEDDSIAIVQQVREAADVDFESALEDYASKRMNGTGHRRVRTRIILDETCFDPPVDLNNDGDFDDSDLRPEQVNAAFIEMTVAWGHNKSFTAIDLVRRKSPRSKISLSKPLSPGSGDEPSARPR
jgi:hypothetical protein